jgi:prepilin-type N-terminal cleavage/methylation domain-containing protein
MRGFSLTEVLVALLILTLVITSSLAVFVERNRRLQQASEIVLAYQALSNEAEMRRRIEYDYLTRTDMAPLTFLSDTTLLEPLQPYSAIVSVRQPRVGERRVLMTVRWKNGQRQARLELVRVSTGGTRLW